MVIHGFGLCPNMLLIWDNDIPGDFEAGYGAALDYMLGQVGGG